MAIASAHGGRGRRSRPEIIPGAHILGIGRLLMRRRRGEIRWNRSGHFSLKEGTLVFPLRSGGLAILLACLLAFHKRDLTKITHRTTLSPYSGLKGEVLVD